MYSFAIQYTFYAATAKPYISVQLIHATTNVYRNPYIIKSTSNILGVLLYSLVSIVFSSDTLLKTLSLTNIY